MAKCLAELAVALDLPAKAGWEKIMISGICEDTQRLESGNLFVAIPGKDRDGSAFVEMAVKRGAVAILAEHDLSATVPVLITPYARAALAQLSAAFYGYPTHDLFTIGVTGTNGKTTVCHWIAELLGRRLTSLVSTVQNPVLGLPGLTTPPSPIIQALARDAVGTGAQHFVIEASSAGIAQERVGAIEFDACVFTNLSLEHVRHHRGLAAYQRAKMKLFEDLKPDAWAIVNADDPLADKMAAATSARVLRYGCTGKADIQAFDIHLGHRYSQFVVCDRGGAEMRVDVRLPVPGKYNIYNALAAISVGIIAGLPLSVIGQRLMQAPPISGRSAYFRREDGLEAVVDFAHNGASLEALLSTLRPTASRLIVVFGCPGDGEHEKRASMGAACAQWADVVVLTSDNPKHEDPHVIAEDIQAGMVGSQIPVSIIIDRTEAIDAAIDQAVPGDLLVLAGKGHEVEQLIGGARLPHSDADVLRARAFILEDNASDV